MKALIKDLRQNNTPHIRKIVENTYKRNSRKQQKLKRTTSNGWNILSTVNINTSPDQQLYHRWRPLWIKDLTQSKKKGPILLNKVKTLYNMCIHNTYIPQQCHNAITVFEGIG